MKAAKLFRNGQSQAVRLPREFRFKDEYVFIKREGNVVMLIPASRGWSTLVDSLSRFSDDFMKGRNQPAVQQRGEF
jgi:antitoxin VapB